MCCSKECNPFNNAQVRTLLFESWQSKNGSPNIQITNKVHLYTLYINEREETYIEVSADRWINDNHNEGTSEEIRHLIWKLPYEIGFVDSVKIRYAIEITDKLKTGKYKFVGTEFDLVLKDSQGGK